MTQQDNGRRTITCTYHCSACGLHFHSLNAFDAHRTGSYVEPIGSDRGRRCLDLAEIDRLAVLTDVGECRMHDDRRIKTGITVWTHAGDLARLRHHLASERSDGAQIPVPG